MDLYRLQALNREWARVPPVDELVAAFMGHEAPEPVAAGAAPASEEASFAMFEQLFAQAGGRVG